MNILITAPSLNPSQNVNGISTVVITIIQHNKSHNYCHYLLGRPDKPVNKLELVIQIVRQLLFFPIILKREKIDLVHQNLPFNPKGVLREYIINVWCRLLGVPVMLHVHGGVFLMNETKNPIYSRISRTLFRHSKQVVVLSEIEKNSLDSFYQFPLAKVLCNSIDVASYLNKGKRLPKCKPALLFIGRVHESKGVEDIIEAFQKLKATIDFRFILCGIGPLKDQFVTACEELLGSDFEYKGIISGQEKIDIIHQSDFFLLPSRYGEGLPMAMLETMAAGVVPVVTDDASMKFVVHHQINGIRVEKRNPQDLYEKLKDVITNVSLYKSLSINASKTIAEKYDISNYIVELNEIYNSVLIESI